jgi:competence protein ComEC
MIERVSLFNSKKETLYFTLASILLLFLSLALEFYHYKEFTKFDSQLLHATVLKQYTKTKLTKTGKTKEYQVLKLKSEDGLTFYTTASKKTEDIKGKNIELEIWAGDINFYEYMRTFFGFSHIINVSRKETFLSALSDQISKQHESKEVSSIYQALYLAKPLERSLQHTFSNLGVSHLIAISGFHLGVLWAVLFFLLRYPYQFFQKRYFPYRSHKRDSFIFILSFLFAYLLFLDMPPSLLRAFVMLVVGTYLYDRGLKIISMQTLLLTVVIILALFPRLFFNIGFWLSVSGVFYIFLFFIHFKNMSKTWQFFLLPIWIYLMMLPYSLALFSNFSLYHPLSIIWTFLFTLFYPLSIFFHLLGVGYWSDFALLWLIEINAHASILYLSIWWLIFEVFLSLFAIYYRSFLLVLLLYNSALFIYSVYYVA